MYIKDCKTVSVGFKLNTFGICVFTCQKKEKEGEFVVKKTFLIRYFMAKNIFKHSKLKSSRRS